MPNLVGGSSGSMNSVLTYFGRGQSPLWPHGHSLRLRFNDHHSSCDRHYPPPPPQYHQEEYSRGGESNYSDGGDDHQYSRGGEHQYYHGNLSGGGGHTHSGVYHF